jgi:apolipoprotein N-acyltransferase
MIIILFILSFAIVAFGQPNLVSWLGPLSAILGFALFFRILLDVSSMKKRFWLGTLWFALVQMVQLYWSLGHPFSYIYFAYALHVFLLGLQFGLVSLFITPERVRKVSGILGISGLWILLEWSRLYFFSGHPWNPVGLALSGSLYSRQLASLWGVYGLSFWVFFTNLCCLRVWKHFSRAGLAAAAGLALIPYAYGFIHLSAHQISEGASSTKVALVQTNFPIEESLPIGRGDFFSLVKDEWRQILELAKKAAGQGVDLMVLPELVVPYGTYFPVFDYDESVQVFSDIFGEDSASRLPEKWQHLAMNVDGKWMVNNAFWVQGLANILEANIIAGLEDRDYLADGGFNNYTTAYMFRPHRHALQRYEKRVLVPMGEYIPFSFLSDLAAKYGISGSFAPGKSAKVFHGCQVPVGVSICYEETLGHMMRDNRLIGAEMLVNITNDGWFPGYGLHRSHLEHARLRTVEMGIPLVRACNTGVTCALDSFGRDIAVLGVSSNEQESAQDVLIADVPRYSYSTPYTQFGDYLIISLSAFFLVFSFFSDRIKMK